jgi:hypothetical protein
MRKLMITALLTGQSLSAAVPATAAEIYEPQASGQRQFGAFAGARLRVPLGGGKEGAHAGLAFTNIRVDAFGNRRFSKGMEFGFAGDETLRLSLAGQPMQAKKLAFLPGTPGPQGRKAGVSTTGWIAIGVGVVAVGALAYAAWFVSEMNEPHD